MTTGKEQNLLQRITFALMLFAVTCTATKTFAATNEVTTPHVRATLVSEQASIEPGQSFWVALHFDIIEGWHTYWKNAGDSGNPPTIQWTLPDGFEASDIHWPYPERLPVAPLMNYGYSNESWLLVRMTAPQNLDADNVTLNASADWLVCKEECIPEDGKFSLSITTATPANSQRSNWYQR